MKLAEEWYMKFCWCGSCVFDNIKMVQADALRHAADLCGEELGKRAYVTRELTRLVRKLERR